MNSPFTVVSSDPAERVAELDESIHSARVLRWNASQMGDAAGFGRIDRMLEALYVERDAVVAATPSADYDGRVIAARRRSA